MSTKRWSFGSQWDPQSPGAIFYPSAITALGVDSQVHLCVRPKVLIDISLQVDGQMWDAQDGLLHIYKPLLQPT